MADSDQTILFDPHADRHHILGIGALIEIDAAQDREKPVAGAQAPRPGFSINERARNRFRNLRPLEICAGAR